MMISTMSGMQLYTFRMKTILIIRYEKLRNFKALLKASPYFIATLMLYFFFSRCPKIFITSFLDAQFITFFLMLCCPLYFPTSNPPPPLPPLPPSLSRDALVLEVSEKEAREHFIHKLQDARRNAWFTSLNWYVHGLAKDNRA